MEVKLLVKQGPAKTRLIRLKQMETIVGRSRDCDVCIPSAQVSRRHCALTIEDDRLVAEDLNSANGTYLNGYQIVGKVTVNPGDLLAIGPLTFTVEYQLRESVVDTTAYVPLANADDEFEVVEVLPVDAPVKPAKPTVTEEDEGFEIVLDDCEPLELPEGEDWRNLLNKMDK
jgi:pSer/pThr/pTyr-binding forkhead associated (FHA) protein